MSIKNRVLIIILLTVFIACLYSFPLTEYEIKNSGDYYYAEGFGNDYNEALNSARGELANTISANIQSSFKEIMEQKDGDFRHHAVSSVETYSNVTINNIGILQLKSSYPRQTRILAYLSKDQVKQMFEKRKFLIKDYYLRAEEAMACYRIGTALQYYYWSYCLLWTHPDINTIKVPEESISNSYSSSLMITELESKINHIFSSLRFIRVGDYHNKKEKFRRFTFDIKFLDKGQLNDIADLDYCYWNNYRESKYTGISNGMALVTFYGEPANHIHEIVFNIEYQYGHLAARDPMLTEVLRKIKISFKESVFGEIPFKSQSKIMVDLTADNSQVLGVQNTNIEENKLPPDEGNIFLNRYKNTIKKLTNAIKHEEYSDLSEYFTDNGKKAMIQLIEYGNAEILPYSGDYKLWQMNENTYMVRSVPMKFSYSDLSRDFIEDVIFIFDKAGKIEDINFALSDIAINDIYLRDINENPIEEKILIHFLETYKTAYCLERLDYLESVFSQDAQIIIGRSLKSKGNIDDMYKQSLGYDEVELIKMTKDEYINHLKDVFRYSEGINLKFERTKCRRYGTEEIWGVELEQSYYSSRYADWGYLFLMIDLRDTINPIIHIRTWQPQPTKEGHFYDMSDFAW